MKPVFVLVGRPNVGKSTLFNKLTCTRDALVAGMPGLTRDRQYGDGKIAREEYIVVDTGGLSGAKDALNVGMERQTETAIEEADIIFFLVDARAGLTSVDRELASAIRRFNKSVVLVVNKVDGFDPDRVIGDFFSLGFAALVAISASHSRGIEQLIERAFSLLPDIDDESVHNRPEDFERRIRIAIVGRPNVGKSTLINRLTCEERVVVNLFPGTTRDSISVPFQRDKVLYTLIDTAGVRRRSKVVEVVEKFSVIKALRSIDTAHVAILMLDAHEGVSDWDLHLINYIITSGRALVIAMNKCDTLGREVKRNLKYEIDCRLAFARFARIHFISGLTGIGVGQLIKSAYSAYRASRMDISTPELTRMLEYAVQRHQPPMVNGRRIKLRYAHQGGLSPPLIIVHGHQTDRMPASYRRYLNSFFIEALRLEGTPLRLEFRQANNPFGAKSGRSAKMQSRAKSQKKPVRHRTDKRY